MLSPISKNNNEIIVEVQSGQTYSSIADTLKEKDLIRSDFIFKLFIKLNNINHLEAGNYKLKQNMSTREIVSLLSEGESFNPDAIYLTIPEGKHMVEIATYISELTGKSKEVYLNVWNNSEFVDDVIEKYWFVTDTVKNSNVRYALEGYFFPSTYELLNKDVTPEYIAFKLLDQMALILDKYKEQITASNYNVHEILTLASIVEYEAILDKDRNIIAGVFFNRLNDGWKLQSCATIGYAIDEWKLTYTSADMAVNSPYNTYYYTGLPVGPGNSPSEKSIEAVLNPTESDYYYFMSDVCLDGYGEDNKVYYSKTIDEHQSYINKYLTCF